MDNVDLKLLTIFQEIYKTRSISQAAENLEMGQPAISMSLAKFRKHFDDPLFVRTSNGMEPTPHARELIQPVREAIALLKTALGHQILFDPETSARMFRLCMNDVGQRVIMPHLLPYLRDIAPAVRIDVSYVSERTSKGLESGDLDLAIGFLPEQGAGFFQQKLFKDQFVCIVNAAHPRIRHKLSLAAYQAESHVVVTQPGTGHGLVEQTLSDLKIERTIGLRIPNYLGIPSTIESTDFIATVPRRFAMALMGADKIQVLEPPFKIAEYRVMQHWHERYARDPATVWMRKVMTHLFGE
jgi:DNA-binding transcriptional LysR family regulator